MRIETRSEWLSRSRSSVRISPSLAATMSSAAPESDLVAVTEQHQIALAQAGRRRRAVGVDRLHQQPLQPDRWKIGDAELGTE